MLQLKGQKDCVEKSNLLQPFANDSLSVVSPANTFWKTHKQDHHQFSSWLSLFQFENWIKWSIEKCSWQSDIVQFADSTKSIHWLWQSAFLDYSKFCFQNFQGFSHVTSLSSTHSIYKGHRLKIKRFWNKIEISLRVNNNAKKLIFHSILLIYPYSFLNITNCVINVLFINSLSRDLFISQLFHVLNAIFISI